VAENENGQEKTEDPTGKKIEKSKADGQIARSKELTTTFSLLGGVIALVWMGGDISEVLMGMMKFNFSMPREVVFDQNLMLRYLASSAYAAVMSLLPLFAIFIVLAIAGSAALGGVLFSAKAIAPKFSKMNPIKGIKKMFSPTSLVELVKSVAKVTLVGGVAVVVLLHSKSQILALAQSPIEMAVASMMSIIGWSIVMVSLPMIIISMMDVPYQLYNHNKQLRMTKQEVKDEHKDSEGKPEIKSKVRQMQYELAQRRMLQAIPEADVVITNPEHFSVALKYDADNKGAPILVAKGIDFMAIKIREVAKANDVLIIPIPPLARAVYFTTEIEQEIPSELYLAVAQVLAYVFQLKAYEKKQGKKPKSLADIVVPAGSLYDVDGRKVAPNE
jgi:flagellar biosynthetic protein FlhB